MGKRLIFKNVDFSADSFIVKNPTWYLGYTDEQLVGNNQVSGSNNFYFKNADITANNLNGKVVQFIKIYARSSGTLTISYIKSSGTGSVLSSENHTVVQGVNVIQLVTPITLSTTRSIGFIGNGITPMWNNAEYGMHFSRVGYTTDYGTKTIPADLGVIE